ncbi:hypothetical protein MLD38_040739 [Melastoma candidum]|nr:hypothetical protein MLD38_040739 [Melastoma candidum]
MKTGLSDSGETLYFPLRGDFGWDFLPKGTRSLLVQPLLEDSDDDMQMTVENKGFMILASSIEYAYNDKDRAWIQAVANKFRSSITL